VSFRRMSSASVAGTCGPAANLIGSETAGPTIWLKECQDNPVYNGVWCFTSCQAGSGAGSGVGSEVFFTTLSFSPAILLELFELEWVNVVVCKASLL